MIAIFCIVISFDLTKEGILYENVRKTSGYG